MVYFCEHLCDWSVPVPSNPGGGESLWCSWVQGYVCVYVGELLCQRCQVLVHRRGKESLQCSWVQGYMMYVCWWTACRRCQTLVHWRGESPPNAPGFKATSGYVGELLCWRCRTLVQHFPYVTVFVKREQRAQFQNAYFHPGTNRLN